MANTLAGSIQPPETSWLHRWISFLAAGFIWLAVTLRSLLVFGDSPAIWQVLALLGTWLLAFLVNTRPLERSRWVAGVMLAAQALVTVAFLYFTKADFFATLFIPVGMQAMQRYPAWLAGGVLGLGSVLTYLFLAGDYGVGETLALVLIYTAGGVFMSAYIWSTRRARSIQSEQQALVAELEQANRKLEALAPQLEQLAAGRERQRLGRELHDSVTQTIFSMTLTTQSALLLLERDPDRVASQLDRLDELSQVAQSEMQVLIARLSPGDLAGSDLVSALQKHLAERRRLDGLETTLQVSGSQPLTTAEAAGLFRIAQEALNNIVKHAGVSTASVRLQLEEPGWMEVEDGGKGFDPSLENTGGRMGLAGMHERAAGIGWSLQVVSAPGKGTHIRVEKVHRGGTST